MDVSRSACRRSDIFSQDIYLAIYDSSNKGNWPFTDNWIMWKILNEEDDLNPEAITASISYITLGNKKDLLLINWQSVDRMGSGVGRNEYWFWI